jgi:hypothetical protein
MINSLFSMESPGSTFAPVVCKLHMPHCGTSMRHVGFISLPFIEWEVSLRIESLGVGLAPTAAPMVWMAAPVPLKTAQNQRITQGPMAEFGILPEAPDGFFSAGAGAVFL